MQDVQTWVRWLLVFCSELGRRERRKQETRHALIEAGLGLVRERGIDGVTVEMITDAAGVSPRTFFNYFAAKEDVLVAVDELEGLARAVEARPAGEEPLQALRAAFHEGAGTVAVNIDQWLVRAQVVEAHPALKARLMATFEPLERRIVEVIARRCGLNAERDLYPAMICAAAMSAGRVAMHRWFEGGCVVPIRTLIDEAFDLLDGGLSPPGTPADSPPTP